MSYFPNYDEFHRISTEVVSHKIKSFTPNIIATNEDKEELK
jgi:hypothetical protein